jgi:hypothetical protein
MTISVLTPLLAIAAWLLGLSILVQVLQEIWKFTTSSKSRAYENALADFLGPFITSHLRQDTLVAVRGPFQLRRVSVAGRLMPLNQVDLVAALQRTAPAWPRIVSRALAVEQRLDAGLNDNARPRAFSQAIQPLLVQMQEANKVARAGEHRMADMVASAGDGKRVFSFLRAWGVVKGEEQPSVSPFDPKQISTAFDSEFFPHARLVNDHYDQFLKSFDHQYRRRNLRQTFLFGFLLAIALNLPFDQIVDRATKIPTDRAITLAHDAQQLYQQAVASGTDQEQMRELTTRALAIASQSAEGATRVDYFINPVDLWARWRTAPATGFGFLFGCLVTALLLAFGAPFWNDITGALLRVAQPNRPEPATKAPSKADSLEDN